VAQAGDALTGITSRVEEISKLMESMARNATDQSGSLDEINVGVSQLDQVTQRNAGMVEESTRSSRQLLEQSKSLFDLVGQFQTKQDRQPVYKLRNRVA
jgi:methyl-accepting chemotaxis protein